MYIFADKITITLAFNKYIDDLESGGSRMCTEVLFFSQNPRHFIRFGMCNLGFFSLNVNEQNLMTIERAK